MVFCALLFHWWLLLGFPI